MAPTAKSLILELLSASASHELSARVAIGAGSLFGISENNVRVALARLSFGPEPSGHQVEQREACPRENREGNEHLEECYAPFSARSQRALP